MKAAVFPRSVTLGGVTLAATLALAVSAQAATKAPHPLTEPASSVTANSATLNGVIATHGAKTAWQFQYGRSAAYGRATPLKRIAAGKGTVRVSWMVKHLTPGTTYHFRLVAVVSNSGGVHRIDGRDEHFTTRGAGRVLLTHTLVPVKAGQAMVSLRCESTSRCAGQLRIDARARVKGTFASVLCAAGSYSLAGKSSGTVKLRARAACLALLRASRHHQLIGKIHVHPSTGQPAFTRRVILALR